MALSFDGWLIGISAIGTVIFCWILGLIWIYKGKKTNAKLLFYMGLAAFFVGFAWLGEVVDFGTILLTGKNIDITSFRIVNIMGFMLLGPSLFLAIYIGAELVIPEKKKYIVVIYGILGVLFELFLFFDPDSTHFIYPEKPGDKIIDNSLALSSPAGIIFVIFLLSLIIVSGLGVLIKAIQLQGILKKKYLFFSIALIIWCTFGILEQLTDLGIAIIFIRISMIISLWFWYLGLREEPEKKEKLKPEKEVKVEGDLFRITKRPDQITEEEVSISKEKKICLVCKGELTGFNIFICSDCKTFYCENCARTLSDMENMCWVCDTPFDESKPVKPFKREEEVEEIEISEKPQKKPKIDKKSFKK